MPPVANWTYWWILVGMADNLGYVEVDLDEITRRIGVSQELVKADLDTVLTYMMSIGRLVRVHGHLGPSGKDLYKMMIANREWSDVSL